MFVFQLLILVFKRIFLDELQQYFPTTMGTIADKWAKNLSPVQSVNVREV